MLICFLISCLLLCVISLVGMLLSMNEWCGYVVSGFYFVFRESDMKCSIGWIMGKLFVLLCGMVMLVIDVGGSGLKVVLFDENGVMLGDCVCVFMLEGVLFEGMVDVLVVLVVLLSVFDWVLIGFFGVVCYGWVLIVLYFGNELWWDFFFVEVLG